MHADDEDLGLANDHVGLLEVGAACADRLHLPSFQHEPRLELVLDEIFVKCLAIVDDAHLRFLYSGWIAMFALESPILAAA